MKELADLLNKGIPTSRMVTYVSDAESAQRVKNFVSSVKPSTDGKVYLLTGLSFTLNELRCVEPAENIMMGERVKTRTLDLLDINKVAKEYFGNTEYGQPFNIYFIKDDGEETTSVVMEQYGVLIGDILIANSETLCVNSRFKVKWDYEEWKNKKISNLPTMI